MPAPPLPDRSPEHRRPAGPQIELAQWEACERQHRDDGSSDTEAEDYFEDELPPAGSTHKVSML